MNIWNQKQQKNSKQTRKQQQQRKQRKKKCEKVRKDTYVLNCEYTTEESENMNTRTWNERTERAKHTENL